MIRPVSLLERLLPSKDEIFAGSHGHGQLVIGPIPYDDLYLTDTIGQILSDRYYLSSFCEVQTPSGIRD
jgi:hypothetical protein